MKALALAIIALSTLLFTPSARAEWTTADTVGEVAFTGLVLVDVTQTRWTLDHGAYEQNPLLGRHPGPARLYLSAAGGCLAHAGVTYLIGRYFNSDWKRIWQVVSFSVELAVVGDNRVAAGAWRFSW